MREQILVLFFSLFVLACDNSASEEKEETPVEKMVIPNIPYQVLSNSPHDVNSFIEGLEFYKGKLY